MQTSSSPNARLALTAVRLCALWLLVGAVAKLVLGTPKDLPEIVRQLTPIGLVTTYVLVIGIELAIVALAWLRPRLAWPVLALLFAFFEWILAQQLSLGAESCGCFGASIKVDPWVMVAVDGVLLVFLLATKPWKHLPRGKTSTFVLAPSLALSFLVPWIAIEMRTRVAAPPTGPAVGARAAGSGIPVEPGTAVDEPLVGAPPGTSEAAGKAPGAAAARATPQKDWIEMKPESWVGRNLVDIPELTDWLPEADLPLFGKLVLWRQGCDHCAKHLREMAATDDGSQPIVLAQLRDPDDLKLARVVDALPQGPHVTLLAFPEGRTFLVTTPWELHVDGGVVTAAVTDPPK